MADPLTTLIVAAGGAVASKEVISKLLGPTAEYLGESTRDLIKKAAGNVTRIFRVSCDKLKGDLAKPGQVHPRVMRGVVDEGRFVEDVFSAEYFGGVLASARTKDGKDDSAVPFVALVKSLSSFQIRLHFIVYSLVARHLATVDATEPHGFLNGLELFIPGDEVLAAMGIHGPEGESHLLLAVTGLIENGLLSRDYYFRFGDLRKGRFATKTNGDGVIVLPNERGASLFMRALGLRGLSPEVLGSVNLDYSLSEGVKSAFEIPHDTTCRQRSHEQPVNEVQTDVDELRDEFESKVSELEVALEDLKEQLLESQDDTADGEKTAVSTEQDHRPAASQQ